jgi:galactonate dehydratase
LKTNVLLFDAKGGRQFAPGMLGAGAGHPELNLGDEVLAALIDQLAALREGAGKGVRLLLDLNFNYKPEGLRRIAKAVEPFDLLWLEMDLFEPKALSVIRQSTTTPIGSLETILGRRNLKPYLENMRSTSPSSTRNGTGSWRRRGWPPWPTPTKSTSPRTISTVRWPMS